jgi:Brp/Blh family beta-carotene 15,15'-monooxygenase
VAAQAVALAVLVAVVGLPHGGLDHRVGRAVLRPALGRRWPRAFAPAYLGVMALVLAGWVLAPLPTLAGFVLLSAVHFGTADGEAGSPGGLVRAALFGGMVVWVPALVRPAEFTRLLTWVVPGEWPEELLFAPAVRCALWLALAAVLGCVAVRPVRAGVPTLGFVALFALAPPLVGFAAYFCGWHSTRELARLARQAAPGEPLVGLGRVLAAAAPVAALAALLGAVGWAVAEADRPLTPGLVRTVFVGLSAVAVPHMLLDLVAARTGANPFAAEGGG